MEKGVNILTIGQNVIVDGAEEAIARYERGEISPEELREIILELDTVYIDKSKFKDTEDDKSLSR
jgi:DNA-binding transcriptional regulator YdaS (Cro superfamily)